MISGLSNGREPDQFRDCRASFFGGAEHHLKRGFRLLHFAAEQNHIFDKVFHPESADGKRSQGKNLIPGFLHRRAGLGAELSHRPPML